MNQKHGLWALLITGGPILIGCVGTVLSLLVQKSFFTAATLSVAMSLLGLVLFVKSKSPLLKKGRLVTFGPHLMESRERRYYWAGYSLVGLGLLISIFLFSSR